MERPVSQLRQRETSFNPEAAAFSPGCNFSSAVKAGPGSITTVEISQAALPMAPMFNYSPFNGPGDRHTFYHSDPLAPAPVRLEDFFSPDVQALVKTLEEHPEIQEIRAPQPPEPEPAKVTEDATEIIPFPSFTIQQEQPQTHGNPVGISELSLSLGLPAAKTDSNNAVSPMPSCTSRAPQAHPGALFGKLIGRALDKPLTAKGLAEMLQNPDVSESLEVLARTSTFRAMPAEPRTEPTSKVEISAHHRIPVPVSAETASPSKGPTLFQHQHRRSSASSISHRKHARVSSNNRRRTSRAKRMDQGPMPSVADIYPDDAHWTPSAPIYETQDYLSYYQKSMENSQVIVGNLFDWPLPAQAYKPEPAPTAAEIAASDVDVHALMTELPEPSLDTLAKLGNSQDLRASIAFTLPCDARPLTPAQRDGSRYGMRLYGLAYGDEWEPPKFGTFEEAQPFRVRPRDHDGWGGREWAISKAWNP